MDASTTTTGITTPTMKEKRESITQVHGWDKVSQIFPDRDAPWDLEMVKAALDSARRYSNHSSKGLRLRDSIHSSTADKLNRSSSSGFTKLMSDESMYCGFGDLSSFMLTLDDDESDDDSSSSSENEDEQEEQQEEQPKPKRACSPFMSELRRVKSSQSSLRSMPELSSHSMPELASSEVSISTLEILDDEDDFYIGGDDSSENQLGMSFRDKSLASLLAKERLLHPTGTLRAILREIDYDAVAPAPEYWDNYFQPMSQERIQAFDAEVAKLVAQGDIVTLRKHYHQQYRRQQNEEDHGDQTNADLVVNACNKVTGETLLHTACQSGSYRVVSFLVKRGGGANCLQVRDNSGKSPLIDACWTNQPNFDIIRLLLQKAPCLLFAPDKRGFLPLQYVPRECYEVWNDFLAGPQVSSRVRMAAQYLALSKSTIEFHQSQQRLQSLLLQRSATK